MGISNNAKEALAAGFVDMDNGTQGKPLTPLPRTAGEWVAILRGLPDMRPGPVDSNVSAAVSAQLGFKQVFSGLLSLRAHTSCYTFLCTSSTHVQSVPVLPL